MPSLLQQLENNEAVLLMYLAGELPFEDREEVEQMLSVDANLRLELAKLREADAAFSQVMRDADDATPLPIPESVAVRRASRAIRQWTVDRVVREAAPAKITRELRFAWWAYPLTAAAMLMIAWLAWWGNHSDSGSNGPKIGPSDDSPIVREDETTNTPSEEIATDGVEADQGNVQYASLFGLHGLEENPDSALTSAEKQLQSLSALSASSTDPPYVPRPIRGFNQ